MINITSLLNANAMILSQQQMTLIKNNNHLDKNKNSSKSFPSSQKKEYIPKHAKKEENERIMYSV